MDGWLDGRVDGCVYPFPPLQTPGLARDGLPGGGGDGRQVTVSRGGGGDCKGISRQTVVPSTDASKTWVIKPPQPLALRVEHSHDPPE